MMKREVERKRLLGRRVFLKALGAGIAAPLAFRMGNLAMAEPSAAPLRLFVFFVPHGVPAEHFLPTGSDLSSSRMMSCFAPYARYVNIVKGLKLNDGAENHAALPAVMTGFNNGGSVNSIDHTIAQALNVDAHFVGARPNEQASWGFGNNNYLVKHGDWTRPIASPLDAAAELFAGAATNTGGNGQPALDENAFRKEALNLTERQIERMQSSLKDLTAEQSKLQVHLESILGLKAALDRPVANNCTTRPPLPTAESLAGKDVYAVDNLRAVVEGHLEVVANAFVCGSARVVSMINLWVTSDMGCDFAGGPAIGKQYHGTLSHATDAATRAEFAAIQGWFYERLADKLLRTLDQPDPMDPANTVLHNSLVYITSELADGAAHNGDSGPKYVGETVFPAVLIGNAGGYLGGKGVVSVQQGRVHTDMLATLAAAMGAPVSDIGGQSVQIIEELKA